MSNIPEPFNWSISRQLKLLGTGLQYENVTKAKTVSAGIRLSHLASEVAAMEAVLHDCLTVMDESGRTACLKELTDSELGKLWLGTIDRIRECLDVTASAKSSGNYS